MSRIYVNQLANGNSVDGVYLIADKQLRANRQGNLYLHLDLRDKTGTVGARLWNVSESLARRFEPGGYLHARGKVQVFQGAFIQIGDDNDVEYTVNGGNENLFGVAQFGDGNGAIVTVSRSGLGANSASGNEIASVTANSNGKRSIRPSPFRGKSRAASLAIGV